MHDYYFMLMLWLNMPVQTYIFPYVCNCIFKQACIFACAWFYACCVFTEFVCSNRYVFCICMIFERFYACSYTHEICMPLFFSCTYLHDSIRMAFMHAHIWLFTPCAPLYIINNYFGCLLGRTGTDLYKAGGTFRNISFIYIWALTSRPSS